MTEALHKMISPSVSGGLFFRLAAYVKHWQQSKTVHQIHSPFVYRFCCEVVQGKATPEGLAIENYRRSLLDHPGSLSWLDLGAGPSSKGSGFRSARIAYLARVSSRNHQEGELILRLARFVKARRILELGTHLGISALYLHAGAPGAQLDTIEGGQSLADFAGNYFQQQGLPIRGHTGDFDDVLDRMDLEPESLDLVFLDGNHRKDPLLHYAHRLIPALRQGGALVVDDLYWSPEMDAGWQALIQMPEISVSIDLFHLGICFVHRPQAKEHFAIRT